MEDLKILFVIDSLGRGGAEKSTQLLAHYLLTKGVQVRIVILDEKITPVYNKVREDGIPIYHLKESNVIANVLKLKSIIRQEKPSLVHSVLFRSNMITRMTRMLYRFIHLESLVNTTYDEERFKDPSVNRQTLGIYKRIDKWTASRFVDHFHSITHTVKAHYVQALHIQPEKISVIFRGRSGINNQRTYKDTGDKIELLNIGRQEFQKGQIYLLQAVHRLRKEGRNVHLKILGREGVATPKMKQFVAEHGLQDQVSFEGYRENVPDYLEAADLFVFPSLYEGLGGALIEAQSYGLPIACNDIPVLREVVVENVNARFFHSEDVDTIVNSIKFFIEDPRKLGEYGKASFSNFQQNFNQDANHEKLLNLYRELCQKYGK